MQSFSSGEDEKQIFLEALVTYADACTLPELTPSCPFYRVGSSGPSCGEQCRSIAESHGVQSRSVGHFTVGGLVLTGRALPIQSVAGIDLFDATQRFISDHQLDLGLQSTTSLLIGLRRALVRPLTSQVAERDRPALAIWGELARRGIEVERIVSGALLKPMAHTLVTSVVAQNLIEDELMRGDYSSIAASLLAFQEAQAWGQVLESALNLSLANGRWSSSRLIDRAPSPPRYVIDWLSTVTKDNDAAEKILAKENVQYAFSREFLGRVEEWLSRLLEEDLTSFLNFAVPPASVFLALPSPHLCRDEIGLWLWDRFTKTNLQEWALSSLLLEYRSSCGEDFPGAPNRVLAERTVQKDDVTQLALDRTAQTKGRRNHPTGLQPIHFAESAARSLRAGDHLAAENIFSGLIELRPTDGEVWNNLGFCQLASDPSKAIFSLRRGAALLRNETPVNVANQVLALHLLGEDELALRTSRKYQEANPNIDHDCFLWQHPSPSASLELVSVRNMNKHLTALEAHIAEFDCAYLAPPAVG